MIDAVGRKPARGFSLIEMMVAISIVSILLAILGAALHASKENSRLLVCKSNLKQWAYALRLYQNEHRGFLPYEDRGEEAMGRVCWFDAADRYFEQSITVPPDATPEEEIDRIKTCPTVKLLDPHAIESFRMNSKLAETNPDSQYYRPYRRTATLNEPASTVLLFDGDTGGDRLSFKGRWRKKDDDVNYRHHISANLLFVDGHAENMERTELARLSEDNDGVRWQPLDTGPWNPDPSGDDDD